MKAKIKAIDLLFHKQVEVECSIRTRIISCLQLSIGDVSLELISYDRVIAEGTMRNNAFTGRSEITAKPCCRKVA